MDFFKLLFDTSDFPARWHCGRWTPGHGWLHIISDIGIWSAYFAIPLVLAYFLANRLDLPFRRVMALFCCFILLCGTTHLMEAVIFWWPAYRLAGAIKFLTASISWMTVVALVQVTPKVLAMRAPDVLEREIEARRKAEEALHRGNAELEARVQQRTSELSDTLNRLAEERQLLYTTLESIREGVIVTDEKGRIVFLNRIAEQATGWSTRDAKELFLPVVFATSSEESNQSSSDRTLRALQSGQSIGGTETTMLKSRSGTEHFIEESVAPLRGENDSQRGAVLVFRDISQQRRDAEEIKNLNEQLQDRVSELETLLDILPIGVLQGDVFCEKIGGNRAAYQMLRLSPGTNASITTTEPRSAKLGFRYLREGRELNSDDLPMQIAARSGKHVNDFEHDLLFDDGTLNTVVCNVAPILGLDGKVKRVIAAFTDITDRKNAEKKLEISMQQLTSLMSSVPLAVIEWDANLVIRRWSGQSQEIFGWTPEEVVGVPLSLLPLIYPPDSANIDQRLRNILDSNSSFVVQKSLNQTKDGSVISCEWYNSLLRNEQGEIIAVLSLGLDVTERLKTEAALRESEERLRLFATASNDGFWEIDVQTNRIWSNEAFERLYGVRPPHLSSSIDWWIEKLHPEDRERVAIDFEKSLLSKEVRWVSEYRIRLPNNEYAYIMDRVFVRRNEEGKALRIVGSMVDLTGQKKAEQEAKRRADEAEEGRGILQAIMEYVPEGITIADAPDAKIRMISHYGIELTGRPAETLIGKNDSDHARAWGISPSDSRSMASYNQLPLSRAVRNGEVIHNEEWSLNRPDGRTIPILCNAGPIRDRTGSIIGGIITWRDISERKRIEDERREVDRRKDEFLAILAHELRNPLAPIRSATQILRMLGPPDPQLQNVRDIIERQVNHMVRLVDELLDLSRITRGKIDLHLCHMKLSDVIQNVIETSTPLIEASNHQLTVELPKSPIFVECDPIRLTQVIANLLNNAAKYTPDGGIISLRVDNDQTQVSVRIKDNGVGIPLSMQREVFLMFSQINHNLKRSQGGLGIGLALAKSLVEMHRGSIDVYSEGDGKGAEFVVRLPLTNAPDAKDGNAIAPFNNNDKQVGSGYKILVVDDNVDAAESIALFLSLIGHSTEVVHNGSECIEQLATSIPDIVLLDLGMPIMDGFETARTIRKLYRGKSIKLVALTGWGQEEDRRRTHAAGFDYHLTKPVDPAALQTLLQSMNELLTEESQ